MTTQLIFLTTGLVCVIAAITGGGVSYKDFSIPKILSPARQWLLGVFGFALVVFASTANISMAFTVFVLLLMLNGLIESGQRDQKYNKWFAEHLGQPQKLIEDAQQTFWEGDYKWTAKFMSQARDAARDDSWQSGYAFLLGAQLALRKKDAVNTRIEIINSIVKASENRAGYFSSRDNLLELKTNLAAVKSAIAGEDKAKSFAAPIRTEIDLIIHATM
jgi:hypothetical protein